MTETRNSLNSVMISDDSISDCSERGFSDIENRIPSSTELKSILRVSYDTNIERKEKAFRIAKFCVMLIIVTICIPIILFDLVYAYTDKSCIDIYPNKLNINMKIYLLVSGYFGLADLFILICYTLFISYKDKHFDEYINILNLFTNVVTKLFLAVWNIIGAIIFWGTLYHKDDCSRSTYNYLFATIIIKLVLISFYLNKKRNNN